MQHPVCLTAALAGAIALAVAVITGCGSGGGGDPPTDAGIDAPPPPRVQQINCPATVALEIIEIVKNTTPPSYDYSPNPAIIPAGGVIRFRLKAEHNARSVERGLFATDFGQTECFRFNTKETHRFACDAHGFVGSIVVQ